jgi:hypothetical protein
MVFEAPPETLPEPCAVREPPWSVVFVQSNQKLSALRISGQNEEDPADAEGGRLTDQTTLDDGLAKQNAGQPQTEHSTPMLPSELRGGLFLTTSPID